MELDEIIYAALKADENLMAATKGIILSTCIEVAPTEDDNTPLPYIIIAETSAQNDVGTKDSLWESETDLVNVSVEISGNSPNEVKRLRRMARRAVLTAIVDLQDNVPTLRSSGYDGIAWDWTKPCYYSTIHYQADMDNNLYSNEQE